MAKKARGGKGKKPTGHGGVRAGAGRKPRTETTRSSDIPWPAVREAAEAGADETEIIRAFAITDAALGDPVTLTKFRDEIAAAHARYKLELRKTIKKRGIKTTKGAGSVNALSLQARNILEWDKQLPAQETEPDLGTARQRLRDLFVKLAEARTEIEGKKVTPLELLYREAQADQANKDA